jgi:hypothetical protein
VRKRRRRMYRRLNSILGCTERTGRNEKLHMPVGYSGQYYCHVQQVENEV